MKHKSRTHEKL